MKKKSCLDWVVKSEVIMLSELRERYELYGWRPSPQLSNDENYLDLVMLITRNSTCRQGHMGCIIVSSSTSGYDQEMVPAEEDVFIENPDNSTIDILEDTLSCKIIGASTNLELYRPFDSDIHAEVGALGDAAKRGKSTFGGTAYITMAPCKRCFTSLFSSGIKRIVARQDLPAVMAKVSNENDIDYCDMKYQAKEQDIRISLLTNKVESQDEFRAEVTAGRKRRAEAKRVRKVERKQLLEKRINQCHDNDSKIVSNGEVRLAIN